MYVASVNQNVITCNHLFINKWISLYDKNILLFGYAVKSWLLFLVLTKNIVKYLLTCHALSLLTAHKVNHLLMSEEKAYSSFDTHA